jgi:hypothetical protein
MGCAPTNRKRSTTPAAQPKRSQSSIFIEKSPSGIKKPNQEREQLTSI